jgi:NADH-quinone oxidoreductase subunit C
MPTANTSKSIESLRARFAGKIREPKEYRGEWTVEIDKTEIAAAATLLKSEGFHYLVDLSGVDNFGEEPRFEVVYEFGSMENDQYLRLKVRASLDDPTVPTVSGVYQTADWHEREAFDMYGIKFSGHPDLRRILMWDGYPYHPLRKDFPLEGKPSELPDGPFTRPAPIVGGPFTTTSACHTAEREPRANPPELD